MAGRQYPFNNPDILEQVREIMINTIIPVEYNWIGDKFRWSHWHNDQIKNYEYNSYSEDNDNFILSNMFRYVVINGRFQDLNTMVMDSCEEGIPPLHFNDLLRSSCYTEPYYMFKKSYNPKPIEIIIGNPIKCVNCENHWIAVEDTMLCRSCCETLVDEDNLVYFCDCCGCEIRAEDVYWCGEDTLCPSCANLETYICEECGERYYNDNRFYHKETNKFICENCIKYHIEEENDNG
jgi:hypothetical protein